jgi:hypothetical protein
VEKYIKYWMRALSKGAGRGGGGIQVIIKIISVVFPAIPEVPIIL